jgi:D-glycero-D-manno-heptose 1,7-bisphosphate phosphatase
VTVRRAAFVDRDGVINELVADPRSGLPESPLRADQVALIPRAAAALRALANAGFLLVGVSNQPAAAKGTVSLAALEAVQARVLELLAREEVKFDAFRVCMHHPDGLVDNLSGPCECRKPAPGMLLDAAAELAVDLGESWMIGDTDADILAGQAAGCRTVLVAHAPSAHKRRGSIDADRTVASLAEASEVIVGAFTRSSGAR